MWWQAVLAVLLLLGSSAPASAQVSQDAQKTCFGPSTEHTISACTTIIDAAGSRTPQDVSRAYRIRGQAYRAKKQDDLALRDFDEAIRIDPLHVEAYIFRGNFLTEKGLLDRALRDFDEALRLRPGYVLAIHGRGYV